MSMMVSFVLSYFPRDVLDEILNLIESVSEDFPSYFYERNRVKVRSTPGHNATRKRSVELTMHLGLHNIIMLQFTTNYDRYKTY